MGKTSDWKFSALVTDKRMRSIKAICPYCNEETTITATLSGKIIDRKSCTHWDMWSFNDNVVEGFFYQLTGASASYPDK